MATFHTILPKIMRFLMALCVLQLYELQKDMQKMFANTWFNLAMKIVWNVQIHKQ